MSDGATLFAYIIAGVFFILTLRGLSNPETSRKGNMFGMVGMAIAILTTLTSPVVQEYVWIVGGIALGGAIGLVIAKKIEMTALPQLVAAFHSLVGLAAVLVATSALLSPESYGLGAPGTIDIDSWLRIRRAQLWQEPCPGDQGDQNMRQQVCQHHRGLVPAQACCSHSRIGDNANRADR